MKQNQQKIEAEAEKLYPKILISVIGDDLNDNQFIDGNKEKRDIWIAGRSAGLERVEKLENILSRIIGSMALERVERFDLNDEAKQLLNK